MKFNCGPSERHQAEQRWIASQEWHSWFAWHPVRLGNPRTGDGTECRWLERLERRNVGNALCLWEYRDSPENGSGDGK